MQTLNIRPSLTQRTDDLQEIITILSGTRFYDKFFDGISKISKYTARLLFSFRLKRLLTNTLASSKYILSILEKYPELITAQDLCSSMENMKKIENVSELVQKQMKGTPFYTKTLVLCQSLLATEQAVENFIIQESFKENTPISSFGEAFNDWNNEEEGVWESYL